VTLGSNPVPRFETFMAVKIQVEVFWVVTLCSSPVGYHFGGYCCPPTSRWMWRWRWQGLSECWYPTATL